MRTRALMAAVIVLAACGDAAPAPGFQPVPDRPTTTIEATVTSTAPANPDHVIDYGVRDPFEAP